LRRFADTDAPLIWELGKIVLHGMREVEAAERFTGTDAIQNTYCTHFPLPDGREWEIEMRPRRV